MPGLWRILQYWTVALCESEGKKCQKLQTKILEVLRIAINRNNIIGNQLTSHDVHSGRFREWSSEVWLNAANQNFVTSIRNKARITNTIYWCFYITRFHTNLTLQITTNLYIKHYSAVVTLLTNWSIFICIIFNVYHHIKRARGGAVGWGAALQIGRSRVRFPMVSLKFFIYIILPAALWPWGWLSL